MHSSFVDCAYNRQGSVLYHMLNVLVVCYTLLYFYFADIILSVCDVEAVLIILNFHVISATIFQKSNQECHFVMAPLIPNVFPKIKTIVKNFSCHFIIPQEIVLTGFQFLS